MFSGFEMENLLFWALKNNEREQILHSGLDSCKTKSISVYKSLSCSVDLVRGIQWGQSLVFVVL